MITQTVSQFLSTRLTESYISKIAALDLADIRFDESAATLISIKKLLLKVIQSEVFLLPEDNSFLDSKLAELETVLVRLDSLTAKDNPNFPADCERIKRDITGIFTQLRDSLSKPVSFADSSLDSDLAQTELVRIKEISNRMEEIYANKKAEVREQGSVISTDYFNSLANEFKIKAESSQKSLYWCLGGVSLTGIVLAFSGKVNITSLKQFHDSLPFLNLLVVGWFVVNHFSKSHRVYENLQIMYKTKSTILDAGTKFALSTDDNFAKDKVTTTIVANTFTVEETGLLSKRDDQQSRGLITKLISQLMPSQRTSG